MNDTSDVAHLAEALRRFTEARDWGQFHTPKNLAMALSGEVGELLAELQWLTEQQICDGLTDPSFRERVEDEVADVLMYLLRFADVAGIDVVAAVRAKMARNEERYPVDRARGNARKYTDLADSSQD